MLDPKTGLDIRDHEWPRDTYTGDLPGEHIHHSSTFWRDENGVQHRESYNYDENGYIENLHTDKGPGPWRD